MVRRLRDGDVEAAVALTNAADWGFDADDFRAMLEMDPDGLFCAEDGGDVVGLTTTAAYEDLGWIGNVVVHPDHRKQGLGTDLVEAALDHLDEQGVGAVGLYSLPPARGIYDRLGFDPLFDVVSLTGEATGGGSAGDVDVEAVLERDRRHVDFDRERYLRYLLGREDVDAVADEAGYLLVRHGTVTELGPGVADPDRPDAAADLIEQALRLADGDVEASLPATAPAVEAWRDAGLNEAFTATTMLLGDHSLYDADAIVGVLGLEKG